MTFSMLRRSTRYTLFPYTTLFRSIIKNRQEGIAIIPVNVDIDSSCTGSNAVVDEIGASRLGRVADAAERLYERGRSEEHTSELQSQSNLVCRLWPEQKSGRSSGPA